MNRITRVSPRLPLVLAVMAFISGNIPLSGQSTAPAASRPGGPPASQPAASNPATTEPQFQSKRDRLAEVVARMISKNYGWEIWRSRNAFQADFALEFTGKPALEGTMSYDIIRGRSRIDLKDGTKLVFDGQKVWVSPASAKFTGARSNLATWSFLLTAPARLQEPAIIATDYYEKLFHGEPCDSIRVTFKNGAVQTPGDWYRVYAGRQDHEVRGIAFMMKEADGAGSVKAQQRAASFDGFKRIDGISLPTSWIFWNSDDMHGADGEPIGKAAITNMKFIQPADDMFTKPADAREDES